MEGLLKAFWVESNIVYVIVNKGKRAIFQKKNVKIRYKFPKNGIKLRVARKRGLFSTDTKVHRPKAPCCKRWNAATENEKWGAFLTVKHRLHFLPSNIKRCMAKEERFYQVIIYISYYWTYITEAKRIKLREVHKFSYLPRFWFTKLLKRS